MHEAQANIFLSVQESKKKKLKLGHQNSKLLWKCDPNGINLNFHQKVDADTLKGSVICSNLTFCLINIIIICSIISSAERIHKFIIDKIHYIVIEILIVIVNYIIQKEGNQLESFVLLLFKNWVFFDWNHLSLKGFVQFCFIFLIFLNFIVTDKWRKDFSLSATTNAYSWS